ncbi:vWA domain-containing protein [Frateuria aurantia]
MDALHRRRWTSTPAPRPGRQPRSARIDWPGSVAAAAGRRLRREDLRHRRGRSGGGLLDCYLLDCSGSMLLEDRLARAKGLLAACFAEAARDRRRVMLVGYGGQQAYTAFAPAVPRWWNERWIQPIGGGGGTPLKLGLQRAAELAHQARRRTPGLQVRLWLLTDGRCPDAARPGWADALSVLDFGQQGPAPSRARRLATRWQAVYLDPSALQPDPYGSPSKG